MAFNSKSQAPDSNLTMSDSPSVPSTPAHLARPSDDEEDLSGSNLGFAFVYGEVKRIIDEINVLEQELIQKALECTPGHPVDDSKACKSIRSSQLAVDAATSTAYSRELGRARQRRPA